MIEISLGGKLYPIKSPLTLGQLIDLRVAVSLAPAGDSQEEVRRSWKRMVDVVVTALQSVDPKMTAAKLMSENIGTDEIVVAAGAVLELSGLTTSKDAKPGEAEAEAV